MRVLAILLVGLLAIGWGCAKLGPGQIFTDHDKVSHQTWRVGSDNDGGIGSGGNPGDDSGGGNPGDDPGGDPGGGNPGGDKGDHDCGHGNDSDGHDEDNPGNSDGPGPR